MPADKTPAPAPLTAAELDALDSYTEFSAMEPHGKVKRLVAEVRRLRVANAPDGVCDRIMAAMRYGADDLRWPPGTDWLAAACNLIREAMARPASAALASQSPSLVALPVEDLALCSDTLPKVGHRIVWENGLLAWWSWAPGAPRKIIGLPNAGTVVAVPSSHMDAVQYVIVRLDKAPAPASPAVDLPSEAPPGTVRVRTAVYHGPYAGGYYFDQLGAGEKPGSGCLAILTADVPLPPEPPVVQARVEPAPAKEGGAS